MDPPPQAHTGVGHAPEYTTAARTGQLTVTMRTHCDSEHITAGPKPGAKPGVRPGTDSPGRPQREPAEAPASACAFTGPPTVASAAAYRSAGRTPPSAVTRCPSGRTSSTVCAAAPG